MRVLVALTLCLALTSTQASFLDAFKNTFAHIGDAFTQTFHQMGQQATEVGKQLLAQATDQGKQILGQTAQSLLLGTMNAIQGSSPHTRDLRSLAQELSPFLNHAEAILDEKNHQFQSLLEAAMGKLNGIAQQITQLSPEEIASKVDSVVAAHNQMADQLLRELGTALTSHHKRNAFTDAMNSMGTSITGLFAPHIHAVEDLLKGTATAIKQGSASFAASVAESMNQLGGQLSQHLTSISESGKNILHEGANAASALKQAMLAAMHQTLTDVQPHLQDLLHTGESALGVAAGALIGSLAQELVQDASAAIHGAPAQR